MPPRKSQAMGLVPGPSLGGSSLGGTWCSTHLLNAVSEEMEELQIQMLFRLFSPILAKSRYGFHSVVLFPPWRKKDFSKSFQVPTQIGRIIWI